MNTNAEYKTPQTFDEAKTSAVPAPPPGGSAQPSATPAAATPRKAQKAAPKRSARGPGAKAVPTAAKAPKRKRDRKKVQPKRTAKPSAGIRSKRKPGRPRGVKNKAREVAKEITRLVDLKTALDLFAGMTPKNVQTVLAIAAHLDPLHKGDRVRIMAAVARLYT